MRHGVTVEFGLLGDTLLTSDRRTGSAGKVGWPVRHPTKPSCE